MYRKMTKQDLIDFRKDLLEMIENSEKYIERKNKRGYTGYTAEFIEVVNNTIQSSEKSIKDNKICIEIIEQQLKDEYQYDTTLIEEQ